MIARDKLKLAEERRRVEAYTLAVLTGLIARSPLQMDSIEIIMAEKFAKATARKIVKGGAE